MLNWACIIMFVCRHIFLLILHCSASKKTFCVGGRPKNCNRKNFAESKELEKSQLIW